MRSTAVVAVCQSALRPTDIWSVEEQRRAATRAAARLDRSSSVIRAALVMTIVALDLTAAVAYRRPYARLDVEERDRILKIWRTSRAPLVPDMIDAAGVLSAAEAIAARAPEGR